MGLETDNQVVRLEEVAAWHGMPVTAARSRVRDKDIGYDWLGVEVVTWATARRLSGEFTAAKEAAAEQQRQYELEQERKIEAEREAYRREREAERAKHGRVIAGVQVSVPGDPHTPEWMASE